MKEHTKVCRTNELATRFIQFNTASYACRYFVLFIPDSKTWYFLFIWSIVVFSICFISIVSGACHSETELWDLLNPRGWLQLNYAIEIHLFLQFFILYPCVTSVIASSSDIYFKPHLFYYFVFNRQFCNKRISLQKNCLGFLRMSSYCAISQIELN